MRNLFIGVNPNIQKDDLWLVFKLLFQPWKWRNEKYVEEFESDVEKYMNNDKGEFRAVAFDSARSGFALLLKEMGIGKNDEVLMPSFTCVVIVNSVLKVGATPVYVDIERQTYNINLDDLDKRLTKQTKAILVQHTFGVPVDVEKVRKIVGEDVKIIEDVAHIMGGENNKGKKYGTLGDAAILTFGIEKMMTSLRGGMVMVKDDKLYKRLKEIQKQASRFSLLRIKVWLLNPLFWAIITPLYFVGIGKYTVGRFFSQIGHKFGLMGNMMEPCEYKGEFPSWMPAKMPGALALLGRHQLAKLDKFNAHRREIAEIYDEKLGENYSKYTGYTALRYPVLVRNREALKREMKNQHVIIGNWYERILFTKPEYLSLLNLNPKDYPNLEFITEHVVNLPLFIKVKDSDAQQIAGIVSRFLLH